MPPKVLYLKYGKNPKYEISQAHMVPIERKIRNFLETQPEGTKLIVPQKGTYTYEHKRSFGIF